MSALAVELLKTFASGRQRSFTLDVKLAAAAGVTVIFGPSGSGKTTMLQCIAGLLKPDQGHISAGSEVMLDTQSGIDLPAQQRRIGYVFQDLALFPHMSAAANIGFGIRVNGNEKIRMVNEIMERFRIAHLSKELPAAISGGERQRVALARALVTHPRALLLDEPFSALDDDLKSEIIADLKQWLAQQEIPVLFVTHDRSEAAALGQRMLVLREGKILREEQMVVNGTVVG